MVFGRIENALVIRETGFLGFQTTPGAETTPWPFGFPR
jgi:hypothetical protein